jgi:hypothetical protein
MSEAVALENKGAAIGESGKILEEEQPESQVEWSSIWKPMVIIIGVFALFFWLPVDSSRFTGAVIESLALARWYAREHVLLCLIPAFFIAGAISVFVSQAAVMKYLGAGARKVMSYGVASVSGTILAVCSARYYHCLPASGSAVRGWARQLPFCIPDRPSMCWRLC